MFESTKRNHDHTKEKEILYGSLELSFIHFRAHPISGIARRIRNTYRIRYLC